MDFRKLAAFFDGLVAAEFAALVRELEATGIDSEESIRLAGLCTGDLRARLFELSHRVLVAHYQVVEQDVAFEAYCDLLREPSVREYLHAGYPVLRDAMLLTARVWREQSAKLLHRFHADHARLRATLLPSSAPLREPFAAAPSALQRATLGTSPPAPRTPPREPLAYTARKPLDAPPLVSTFDAGRVAKLQLELDEAQHRASKLLGELSSLRPAMLELEAARARIAALERQVAELMAAGAEVGGDDLRCIKGIGPKFEKALHAVGIRTYADIAAWSDAEIIDIAAKIGARADRIERDAWVASAKALVARASH